MDKWLEAEGYLAADSGLTKMFLLHVPLREYSLLLPAVWIDGEFVDLLHGESVTIEEMPATKRDLDRLFPTFFVKSPSSA